MSSKKQTIWWLLMAVGVVFLVIGILAFTRPLNSYAKLSKYAGAGLLINGILLQAVIVVNKKYPQERGWMQAESILDFLFALVLLFNPILSFILLPYLIGIWILLVGLLKTLAAVNLRKILRGWRFILAVGVLSVIFGLMLLYFPFARAEGITLFIGAFAAFMGALYILDAYHYRKREDTLELML